MQDSRYLGAYILGVSKFCAADLDRFLNATIMIRESFARRIRDIFTCARITDVKRLRTGFMVTITQILEKDYNIITCSIKFHLLLRYHNASH